MVDAKPTSTSRQPDELAPPSDRGGGGGRAGAARMCVAWTASTVVVVAVALGLQTARLHRRDAELARREQAVKQMEQIVNQLKKNNDEREKRLHDLADNLEEMYHLVRAQMPGSAPTVDPGVRQATHRDDVPVAGLPPAGH